MSYSCPNVSYSCPKCRGVGGAGSAPAFPVLLELTEHSKGPSQAGNLKPPLTDQLHLSPMATLLSSSHSESNSFSIQVESLSFSSKNVYLALFCLKEQVFLCIRSVS